MNCSKVEVFQNLPEMHVLIIQYPQMQGGSIHSSFKINRAQYIYKFFFLMVRCSSGANRIDLGRRKKKISPAKI